MNSSSLNWRRYPERYALIGNECVPCGKVYFPAKFHCLNCGSKELVKRSMPTKGKIISFTKIHAGPNGFESSDPYYLGLIELENGKKIISQILGDDHDIMIGAIVKKRFRIILNTDEKSIIQYGYKFEVVLNNQSTLSNVI
jgi:uncharacterized protein